MRQIIHRQLSQFEHVYLSPKNYFQLRQKKKLYLRQKEHETIYTFSTKPIRKHFQLRQRKLF